MRTRRLTHALVLPVLLGGALVGCGDEASTPRGGRDTVGSAPSASAVATPTAMPTTLPPVDGPVSTRVPVTVIEGPDQPAELCLGGVADSYPPQCGGPRLTGFVWAEHRGDFEEANGVRWGEFAITGTFDGRSVAVTDVVAAEDFDLSETPEDKGFTTPCPEPEGGWRVLDPDRTTEATMDATFAAAEKLPGYADSWMDTSRNPMTEEEAETQEDFFSMNDPAYVTINVRVTRDVAGAEKALRELWGGALCVTGAEYTRADLNRVQERVDDLPGMLTSGEYDGTVEVYVTYDDGSFQAWADREFGAGLVRVTSALVPVSR